MKRVGELLEAIKFQHTVFALPFAAAGACAAAGGLPSGWQVLWITVAMVSARTAAMLFNRIVDARHDADNPRTRDRAIPAGRVGLPMAKAWTAGAAAVFLLSAAMLNGVVLALAPVALAVTLGYSLLKRVTPLTHLVLGLSLAMAPVGAWLAVSPVLAPFPLLLAAGVLFWVAGFDILYACQDVDFDRKAGLHSIPAALGVPGALRVAKIFHALSVVALAAVVPAAGAGGWYVAGVAAIALLLSYEHALVRPDDLRRVNQAFFHVNAAVSLTLGAATLADVFTR